MWVSPPPLLLQVLEYAVTHYDAKFVLKTDDDAFINVNPIIEQLQMLCENPDCVRERLYIGKMAKHSEVLLTPGHKWNNAIFHNHTGGVLLRLCSCVNSVANGMCVRPMCCLGVSAGPHQGPLHDPCSPRRPESVPQLHDGRRLHHLRRGVPGAGGRALAHAPEVHAHRGRHAGLLAHGHGPAARGPPQVLHLGGSLLLRGPREVGGLGQQQEAVGVELFVAVAGPCSSPRCRGCKFLPLVPGGPAWPGCRKQGQRLVTRFQLAEEFESDLCSLDPWLVLHKIDSPTKMRYVGAKVANCSSTRDPALAGLAPSIEPYLPPHKQAMYQEALQKIKAQRQQEQRVAVVPQAPPQEAGVQQQTGTLQQQPADPQQPVVSQQQPQAVVQPVQLPVQQAQAAVEQQPQALPQVQQAVELQQQQQAIPQQQQAQLSEQQQPQATAQQQPQAVDQQQQQQQLPTTALQASGEGTAAASGGQAVAASAA